MSELPPEVRRLEEAMREFERELAAQAADSWADAWPLLLPDLRRALHRVRDLRKQLRGRVDAALWPRELCPACHGEGVTLHLNPEEEPNWLLVDSCRPCLTTGLVLRPADQWRS